MRPRKRAHPLLPCLRSNICIGEPQTEPIPQNEKAPSIPVAKSAYKTEFCLKTNIEMAAERFGIGHLAFFTPTFAKPIYSAKIAQQRMHSLLTNVIRPRYGDRYIAVFERHESGAIHFHFVVYVQKDIRNGFDWIAAGEAYEAQKQRDFLRARKMWSAAVEKAENGEFLRKEWAFWREMKRRYRWLGRCELLPIKSTAEAIARYTGGYISKHMQHRKEEDKGVNLVRYGKGMHWAKSRLAFNSPRCWLWRERLKQFAFQNGCGSMEALANKFGSRWAYRCAPAVVAMPLLIQLKEKMAFDVSDLAPAAAQQLLRLWPRAGRPTTSPRSLFVKTSAKVNFVLLDSAGVPMEFQSAQLRPVRAG